MEITTHSTQDTKRLAEQLAGKIQPKDVIALYGDLGSGKTTFTSFLVDALGFSNRVQSPTFVIVRNYKSEHNVLPISQIFHIDLYRLTSAAEVMDIGINEMLNTKNAITIIEWPEIYEKNLPKHTKRIRFDYIDETSRRINVHD